MSNYMREIEDYVEERVDKEVEHRLMFELADFFNAQWEYDADGERGFKSFFDKMRKSRKEIRWLEWQIILLFAELVADGRVNIKQDKDSEEASWQLIGYRDITTASKEYGIFDIYHIYYKELRADENDASIKERE